jgi:hypothetical protein
MRGSQLPPRRRVTHHPLAYRSHQQHAAPPVSGRGAASPAVPPTRRFRVADTSRTTRIADQPSGCIHDRPAVNGRAQSPSRLKPATIWRPSVAARPRPVQPPSGGLGIQPGASAPGARLAPTPAVISIRTPATVSFPGPRGPAGQAPPDPYNTRVHAPPIRAGRHRTGDAPPHPCRGEALPRPPAPWARQTPVACIDHAAHPPGTMPIEPPGDCRPCWAGGSGTA